MQKIIYNSLILLFLVGCNETLKDKKNTTVQSARNSDCEREIIYGEQQLCLPKINGLTECYGNPKIQERIHQLNDPTQTILGYYLATELYDTINEKDTISYDNYYQVYAPYMSKNKEIDTLEMNQLMEMMTSGLIDKTSENLMEIDLFSEDTPTIKQPALLEKYALNSNSTTRVILMSLKNDSTDRIVALTMNSVIVNGRIIFITHYLDFSDAATITTLKNNTAIFISKFLETNS